MKDMTKKTPILSKGRPSKYSKELADRICELIATHPNGLVSLCKMYPDLPSPSIIRKWLREPEKQDFLHHYKISLHMRADNFFDEIIDIADTPQIGETITLKAGEREITQADMIQHRRLRIEVRKWIVSKLLPKKYGDASQMQTGEVSEAYQPPKIEVFIGDEAIRKLGM
jgi:hypothetical protein